MVTRRTKRKGPQGLIWRVNYWTFSSVKVATREWLREVFGDKLDRGEIVLEIRPLEHGPIQMKNGSVFRKTWHAEFKNKSDLTLFMLRWW